MPRREDDPVFLGGVSQIDAGVDDTSQHRDRVVVNLGRRAAAASAGRPLLDDPLAVEVAGRLQYDFTNASRGAQWHAVRVATFDRAVGRFLDRHPAGQVAALGEGLETQFWRVDNGQVRWLSVDLPATLELRRRVLPDGPRQSSFAGSALDLDWLGRLDPASPTLVTAQGLLVYFQREEVHELIAAGAERLPRSSFVFDVVPEKMFELVQPGVAAIRDLAPPRAPGVVPLTLGAVRRLPQRVRYALPVFPVLQVRFR